MTAPQGVWVEQMNAGFTKYHVNPDGALPLPCRPVIHHFTEPDVGDPHDHPFRIDVHVIHGWYKAEVWRKNSELHFDQYCSPGDHYLIRPFDIHRIVEVAPGGCVTCCVYGNKVREPGFYRWVDGVAQRRQWNEKEWK